MLAINRWNGLTAAPHIKEEANEHKNVDRGAGRNDRRRERRGAQAQTLEPIKVSYQPALYWSLPYYVATEKKFWAEAGLVPEFSTFPAGAPQVAAAQAKSWDVGGTGSVPAVLGAARFGLVTIGITNDKSKANVLMVRGDKYDAVKKDPAIIKGQKILLTSNSTGDYAVQACLKKWGIAKTDVQLVNLGQAQIISADHIQQRRLRGRLGPQQLHTGGEGRGQAAMQRLRRGGDRAGGFDRPAGFCQGEAGRWSPSTWPSICARGHGSRRTRRKRAR